MIDNLYNEEDLATLIKEGRDLDREKLRKKIRSISRLVYAKAWSPLEKTLTSLEKAEQIVLRNEKVAKVVEKVGRQRFRQWLARQLQTILDEIYTYVWDNDKK